MAFAIVVVGLIFFGLVSIKVYDRFNRLEEYNQKAALEGVKDCD